METRETKETKVKRLPGGFGAGAGASVAMMLVMALLRFTTNTASIPELMEDSLTHLAGGEVEAFFINWLGVGGKALLLVSIVWGTLLAGGLMGLAFARFWPIERQVEGWRWWSGLLYGLIVGTFLNVVFLPLIGQGFFGSQAVQATAPPAIAQWLYGSQFAPFGVPVALNMYLLSLVFGLALVALLPWSRVLTSDDGGEKTTPQSAILSPQSSMGRRGFLKALAGGVLALVGGGVLWYGIREALAPPPVAGPQLGGGEPQAGNTAPSASDAVPQGTPGGVQPRLVPEITPTDSFYITTKNFIDPTVNGATWTLSFKGLVDNPYTVNLEEVLAMPSEERVHTLACISNPVGGSLIGNARWKGVDFGEMLRKARPKEGVVDVVVRAADGYADSFTLDAGLNNGCLLAYEMNGENLNQKHGYPVRLLIPGIFGMKNCKWLTQVELVDHDFKGYWQERGWSDPAPYLTMSRIDYPDKPGIGAEPVYISGIAFAGERGIERVEVSTDGGKSWHDAELRPPTGEHTWVLWTYLWKPEPGEYTLQARATDGTGEVQTAKEQGTFPDGATGYPTRRVRVG